MIITPVYRTNLAPFHSMVPQDLIDFGNPSRFIMGALIDDENDPGKLYAAGVIVFDVKTCSTDEDVIDLGILKWILVDENKTRQGVGKALMGEMFKILYNAGIEGVLTDVPMPKEYNDVVNYLEEWGFEFSFYDKAELIISIGELKENELLYSFNRVNNVVPLKELNPESSRKLMKKIEEDAYFLGDFEESFEDFDNSLSAVYIDEKNNEICAGLLLRREGNGILKVRHVFDGNKPKYLACVLKYCTKEAVESLSEDKYVSFECFSEKSAEYIEKIFPNKDSIMVRRGVTTTFMPGEEDFEDFSDETSQVNLWETQNEYNEENPIKENAGDEELSDEEYEDEDLEKDFSDNFDDKENTSPKVIFDEEEFIRAYREAVKEASLEGKDD